MHLVYKLYNDDISLYNIIVNNYLSSSGQYPLLVIISCVIGVAIVVIAMAMILVLCRKRASAEEKPTCLEAAKKPDVMADTERAGADKRSQNSDRSSCISDLKLDLKDADNSCEMVRNLLFKKNHLSIQNLSSKLFKIFQKQFLCHQFSLLLF